MHPDITRELMNQRTSEMRAAAQRASLARKVRQAVRARRRQHSEFVPPVIPDFVDDLVTGSAPEHQVPPQRNGSHANAR